MTAGRQAGDRQPSCSATQPSTVARTWTRDRPRVSAVLVASAASSSAVVVVVSAVVASEGGTPASSYATSTHHIDSCPTVSSSCCLSSHLDATYSAATTHVRRQVDDWLVRRPY